MSYLTALALSFNNLRTKKARTLLTAFAGSIGIIGIALILALIGIMNYVNTVIGNIQNRQVELAILESIGMTEKQINRMLVLEGVIYAVGSLILTGTIGMGVTYLIFQAMNYRGIAFTIPMIPVLLLIVFIMFVCTVIPVLTSKILSNHVTTIERMKGFE